MGYIFDAMQRAGQPEEPDEAQQPSPTEGDVPYAPIPATPPTQTLTLAGEVADDVPASGPIANATPSGDPGPVDDRLVALTEPVGVMAEEYRAIRTGLLARWQHKRHLVHTITSATPQEGKTITSLNLGVSFAELRNRRSIVIEADLRLPQFSKLLALPESPGLVGLLEGQADLGSVIHRLEGSDLDIIPAGRRANEQAVQLLSSSTAAALIDQLRHKYDHVFIDTPPVIELADAGILGALGDDVLLTVRMNRTPRPLVEQVIRILASYNAPVGGIIGTDNKRTGRRYNYRYGYGYRYGYYGKKAA